MKPHTMTPITDVFTLASLNVVISLDTIMNDILDDMLKDMFQFGMIEKTESLLSIVSYSYRQIWKKFNTHVWCSVNDHTTYSESCTAAREYFIASGMIDVMAFMLVERIEAVYGVCTYLERCEDHMDSYITIDTDDLHRLGRVFASTPTKC